MSTMTASLANVTPAKAISLPSSENLRLGVTLALMVLFLGVAIAGTVTQVAGVVIGAGVMTAALSFYLAFGAAKDVITANNA